MNHEACYLRSQAESMGQTHPMSRAPEDAAGILSGLRTVFPELNSGHAFSGEGYAFVNDIEIVLGCDSRTSVEDRVAALCCVAGAHDAHVSSMSNPELAVTVWWTRFEVAGRGVRVQAAACAEHDGAKSMGTGHPTPEQVIRNALAGFVRQVGPVMRAHGLA